MMIEIYEECMNIVRKEFCFPTPTMEVVNTCPPIDLLLSRLKLTSIELFGVLNP